MKLDRTIAAREEGSWIRLSLGRVNMPGVAVLALCVALWEIYSRTLGSQFDTIASVSQILSAMRDLAVNGPLLSQLAHTVSVALIGWVMASVMGFIMGLAIGLWKPVWTYTMASIDVLRSVPSISFVSIALLLFGFSSKMELVIVVYVSQWPVLMGTLGGIRSVPGSLLDVSRSLRLSRTATIFKILLPAALPSIIVGLRLALTLSIALAVVSEMVGNPEGLGFGIVFSQQAVRPAQAFAYLVVIGILGWGLNAIFVFATSHIYRGHGQVL